MSGLEPLMIAGIIGGVASAGASIYAGYQTKVASDQAAARARTAGQAEFAASQRDAVEKKLQGDLVLSRQQAAAASSGAGAGNDAPTIVRLMTETSKRIQYGLDQTGYQGRARRQGYLDSADATQASGNASFLGSILTGVGRLAEAYPV